MRLCTVALTASLAVASFAQSGKSPYSDLLNIQTKIGSFKLINGVGSCSFTFEGTVLLVDVKGDVSVEGAVKKEFDDEKMKRKAYFGKGKVTIKGSWRGIQWFGANMTGHVQGKCTVRLTGEFDNNLDTGFFWFGDRVNEKNPWYTTGLTVEIPENPRLNGKPIRRGGYGGG